MAYRATGRGRPRHFYSTFAVPSIGIDYNADIETWVSYCISTAQAADFSIYNSTFSSYADAGKFLALIAGPAVLIDGLVVTPEGVFAGSVAKLAPQHAPTNKVVPVQGLKFKFFDDQLRALTTENLITFKFNDVGNVICTAADVYASPISANQESDYVHMATGRVVFAFVKAVRAIGEQYIGEPISRANLAALGTAISDYIEYQKQIGVIQGATFRIDSSTRDQITGTVKIKAIIIPALEMRKLELNIALQAPAALSV